MKLLIILRTIDFKPELGGLDSNLRLQLSPTDTIKLSRQRFHFCRVLQLLRFPLAFLNNLSI
jgi:hypothetical protein